MQRTRALSLISRLSSQLDVCNAQLPSPWLHYFSQFLLFYLLPFITHPHRHIDPVHTAPPFLVCHPFHHPTIVNNTITTAHRLPPLPLSPKTPRHHQAPLRRWQQNPPRRPPRSLPTAHYRRSPIKHPRHPSLQQSAGRALQRGTRAPPPRLLPHPFRVEGAMEAVDGGCKIHLHHRQAT